MKQVQVVFKRYGEYTGTSYSYHTDIDLKAGDEVIVETNDGFQVVMVTGTLPCEKATAWVVQKIDKDDWEFNKAFRH